MEEYGDHVIVCSWLCDSFQSMFIPFLEKNMQDKVKVAQLKNHLSTASRQNTHLHQTLAAAQEKMEASGRDCDHLKIEMSKMELELMKLQEEVKTEQNKSTRLSDANNLLTEQNALLLNELQTARTELETLKTTHLQLVQEQRARELGMKQLKDQSSIVPESQEAANEPAVVATETSSSSSSSSSPPPSGDQHAHLSVSLDTSYVECLKEVDLDTALGRLKFASPKVHW